MVEGDNSDFIITVVLFKVLTTTIFGSSLKTFCDWIGLWSEVADLSIVEGMIKERGHRAQSQPHAMGKGFSLFKTNILPL